MNSHGRWWWWDDALKHANGRAMLYGRRMRVKRQGDGWVVLDVEVPA